MYSSLVNDSCKHKKAKYVNKNIVATISYNEYKDSLLNNNCLKNSINKVKNKIYRIGT